MLPGPLSFIMLACYWTSQPWYCQHSKWFPVLLATDLINFLSAIKIKWMLSQLSFNYLFVSCGKWTATITNLTVGSDLQLKSLIFYKWLNSLPLGWGLRSRMLTIVDNLPLECYCLYLPVSTVCLAVRTIDSLWVKQHAPLSVFRWQWWHDIWLSGRFCCCLDISHR